MVSRKTRLMSALLAILMVVSMLTAFVLPAVAEDADLSSYPSVTKYDADNQVSDYTVSTVEEWNYLGTLAKGSMSINTTVHVTADLDFKGEAATPSDELYAKIDGHGHTISNIKQTRASIFKNYRGTSLKNITFENCSSVEDSRGYAAALLFNNLYVNNKYPVNIEGLKMINCSISRPAGLKVSGIGLIVGRFNAGKVLNFKDIVIEGCSISSETATWGVGFLVNAVNETGDKRIKAINVDGLYMNNNTVIGTISGGVGVITGEIISTDTNTFKNIGVFNTTGNGTSTIGLIGQAKTDTTKMVFENIIMADNPGISKVVGLHTSAGTPTITSTTNCYTDAATYGTFTQCTTEQVMCGEAAYLANQNTNSGVKKWEYLPGATYPTFDTDGAGLPFEVTVEVTNGITNEAMEDITAYTDTEGKLIPPTSVILTSDPDTVYTKDGTTTAIATWWPLASTVADNFESKGFIINSVAELNAAKTNQGSYTNAQTLYITKDLDLTGSGFTGFGTLSASIDGGNHTISDWTASTTGFIKEFKGTTLKNLTFKNAQVTCSGASALVIYRNSAVTTLDNVDIVDSKLTVTGTTQRWRTGMLLTYMTSSATIKNCDVSNSTIYTREATSDYAYAFIVGQNSYGHVLNISDVTIKGCTLDATIAGSAAFCIAAVETSATVNASNILIEDCVRTAESTGGFTGGFIGVLKTGVANKVNWPNTTLYADNITIKNTTMAGKASQAGLFMGKMFCDNSYVGYPKMVASDVFITESTQAMSGGNYTGTAIGQIAGINGNAASALAFVNNFVMTDCVRQNSPGGWNDSGEFVGWIGNGAAYDFKNVVMMGNTHDATSNYQSITMNPHGSSVDQANSSLTNCFTDKGAFSGGTGSAAVENAVGNKKTSDFAMMAYTINSDRDLVISDTETVTSSNKWEVTADGKLAVDTDGKGLPIQITLEIADELNGGTETDYLYTDVTGKLVGADKFLAENYIYIWEKDLKDSVFTKEETIKGRKLTLSDLKDKVNYLTGKDSKYFTNGVDDTTFDADLATIAKKVADKNYNAQTEIAADYAILNAYDYKEDVMIAMSDYATYPDAPNLTISTVEELGLAGTNSKYFAADQTLYLLNSLSLSESAFAGFSELKASFDGGENTISDWTSTGAFFQSYKGTSVKDLTLSDVTVTVNDNNKGVLFDLYTQDNVLNVENVHLDGCTLTVTASKWHYGCFIGFVSTGTVNITDCTVNNCAVASGEDNNTIGNAGIAIGTIRELGTVNITDFVVQNSELRAYSGQDAVMGIAIAGVEVHSTKANSYGTLNINNMAVIGNKHLNSGMGWQNRGILVGIVKGGAYGGGEEARGKSIVDINNVIVLNNQQAAADQNEEVIHDDNTAEGWGKYNPVLNFHASADQEKSRISNVYTDMGDVASNITLENCKANVTADDYGAIAYAINKNLSVKIDDNTTLTSTTQWTVNGEGKLVAAGEDDALPVAVTLKAADAIFPDRKLETVLYTDTNGNLIGLGNEVAITDGDKVDLLTGVTWNDEVSDTATYDKDVTIDGVLKTIYAYYDVTAPATAKDGDTINVTFGVANNPGFAGADILVTYDADMLTFKSAKAVDDNLFGGVVAADDGKGTVTVKFAALENGKDFTSSDAFAKLTFEVKKPTNGGETTITVATQEKVSETDNIDGVVNVAGDTKTVYAGKATIDVESSLPTLVVNDAEGYRGRKVEVLVDLKNNTGVLGGKMDVTYDADVMTLTNAEAVKWNATVVPPEVSDTDSGEVTKQVAIVSGELMEGNGTLVKLTFTIKDNAAEGNTTVKVVPTEGDGFVTEDGEEEKAVTVLGGEGTVKISAVLPGDVNGDGRVGIADAVLIFRYVNEDSMEGLPFDVNAADVDGAAGVDLNDVIRVLQYLNGSISTL